MTIKEIVKTLLSIGKAQSNVRYVNEGDIYTLNSLPNIEYGVFYITQNKHSITADFNLINYNLNLFYVDRLTTDGNNKLDIQSAGMITLTNIINIFKNNFDVDVVGDVVFQPFTQRFGDECAGVYCTITINADNPIGDCEI